LGNTQIKNKKTKLSKWRYFNATRFFSGRRLVFFPFLSCLFLLETNHNGRPLYLEARRTIMLPPGIVRACVVSLSRVRTTAMTPTCERGGGRARRETKCRRPPRATARSPLALFFGKQNT
jgi:hypothetical protein